MGRSHNGDGHSLFPKRKKKSETSYRVRRGIDWGMFRGVSGISTRKGDLPTAIEAGVSEVLLMQSSHCEYSAARAYVSLDSLA